MIAVMAGFVPAALGHGQDNKPDELGSVSSGTAYRFKPTNASLTMFLGPPSATALTINYEGQSRSFTAAEVWEALKS